MVSLKIKALDFNKDQAQDKEYKISATLDTKDSKTIAYVVRWQLSRKRSGSAKVKSMAEISGTTAKPYKQKGTGRARQGSRRSVQFVGGRTCHGPTPRSFDFSIPKKIAKKALSDVLKLKLTEKKLFTFSDFGSEIKTAKVSKFLTANKLDSVLFVCESSESEALLKSAKNLKNVKVLDIKALNVYDIINFDNVLVDSKIFENKLLGAIN